MTNLSIIMTTRPIITTRSIMTTLFIIKALPSITINISMIRSWPMMKISSRMNTISIMKMLALITTPSIIKISVKIRI